MHVCCLIRMDNISNLKFEFRLPKDLRDRFNLACRQSWVNSSSVLRMLMSNYIEDHTSNNKSDKIYSVAFSDYLLKGFDIPFLSEENEEVYSIYYPLEDEIANDIRKTVVAYLKTN